MHVNAKEKTAMEIIVKLYSTKSVLGATTTKLNAVRVQKKKKSTAEEVGPGQKNKCDKTVLNGPRESLFKQTLKSLKYLRAIYLVAPALVLNKGLLFSLVEQED